MLATIAGCWVKPSVIIIESHLERELRLKRKEETDHLLDGVERSRDIEFGTVKDFLGFFFALRDHMASPPGMDPAREVIQGRRVDPLVRKYWMAKADQALSDLQRHDDGNEGVLLLWLHLRPPRQIGMQVVDGRRVGAYDSGGVGVRELYQAPDYRLAYGRSRRAAEAAFWFALEHVEDYALNRHWVRGRVPREKAKTSEKVYRRGG